VGLEQDGIKAYLPTADLKQRRDLYSIDRFAYDAERDCFICPQGNELPLRVRRKSEQVFVYQADPAICNACPVKAQCTHSKSGRHIFGSFFYLYLDRAETYRHTEAYKKAMRKRKVWPEPLFGEAKQWHNMRQFRLRRLRKVNIEGLMIAAGQNIKRLLRHKHWRKPLKPAATQALAVPVSSTVLVFRCFSWFETTFRASDRIHPISGLPC
jgi:hypothetical protein